MKHSNAFPRSGVLVLGPNSVDSLLPLNLISQVERSLESHRISDAVQLVELHRLKLQAKVSVDEDEVSTCPGAYPGTCPLAPIALYLYQKDELRYAYQRIGFQCFKETLFQDAGEHLFSGELDPRVLISYFPELSGALFHQRDSIDLFSGVAEHMPTENSVDEMSELIYREIPHYFLGCYWDFLTSPPLTQVLIGTDTSRVKPSQELLSPPSTRRAAERGSTQGLGDDCPGYAGSVFAEMAGEADSGQSDCSCSLHGES